MSGEHMRRPGARGRSPGAGLVPPGSPQGWVRLDRPANDNKAPLGRRIVALGRRLLLPALAAALIYGVWQGW
ncbi:hypothetical protein L2U69_02985 [Zavarzinia compransoris]|uniref:hypothetical protein n=1 Tax=Zavarzinia marina TaxID=2911065 RepID=UPI001F3DEA30|nr:hypothetical protein [Zavarzinia marina]MCF4164609.1 hypothetical protein [Zavarzinia marina]